MWDSDQWTTLAQRGWSRLIFGHYWSLSKSVISAELPACPHKCILRTDTSLNSVKWNFSHIYCIWFIFNSVDTKHLIFKCNLFSKFALKVYNICVRGSMYKTQRLSDWMNVWLTTDMLPVSYMLHLTVFLQGLIIACWISKQNPQWSVGQTLLKYFLVCR